VLARGARAIYLIAENPHTEFIIHALAPPAGGRGIAVDVDTEFCVRPLQLLAVVIEVRRNADDFEVAAIRTQETPGAIGPVLDVVSIHVTLMRAAGETAPGVAGVERAANRSPVKARTLE
jgi:hypothetical protein